MAKKTPKDAGAAYLAEVLKHVPEDKRKGIEEALMGSEAALTTLGSGVLNREEADALAASVRAKHGELTEWYGKTLKQINEGTAAKAEAEALKSRLAALEADKGEQDDDDDDKPARRKPAPVKLPDNLATKEDVAKVLADRVGMSEAQGIEYINTMISLGLDHQAKYKEVLDPNALVALAKSKGLNLRQAYDVMTADKREAAVKQERKDWETQTRAEIEKDLRSKMGIAMPVAAGRDEGPSPLSGLLPDAKAGEFTVKAALDEYYQMTARQGN